MPQSHRIWIEPRNNQHLPSFALTHTNDTRQSSIAQHQMQFVHFQIPNSKWFPQHTAWAYNIVRIESMASPDRQTQQNANYKIDARVSGKLNWN